MICKKCNKESDGVHTCTPTYRIVKYRGDNCPWCKVLAPIFEEAKGRNTREDIEFHEVNIAEDEEQTKVLKIRSIPTIIIFKWDEELARKTWVQMPNEFKEWIYNLCK